MPARNNDEYRAALRRRHTRRWSWRRLRRMCRCGDGWPCPTLRALIADSPGHWPA